MRTGYNMQGKAVVNVPTQSKEGIRTKLFEIQEMMLKYTKGAYNPFCKSKYIDLDSLLEKLLPICNEKKILIAHGGSADYWITQAVDVEDGSKVESWFPLPEGVDAQKMGAAITYAKRYNLGSIFNIVTDGDDDGNAASGKIISKKDDF